MVLLDMSSQQSTFYLISGCVRTTIFILLLILVVKAIKYLNMRLKHDCSTCIYKQKYINDQLTNVSSNNDD